MTTDDVIDKLRALKLTYIQDNVGANPALLPNYFQEFLGYGTLLYDYYAEVVSRFELREAEVYKEENTRRLEVNKVATKSNEKMSATELDQRVGIRIAALKAERKRLEQIVRGTTIHINGCQSLMKNYGDESKGIR
jgi:hypothetical protein